jgi:phospholipid/cholesterol/gamma-HCH transport system substrate-binding protein
VARLSLKSFLAPLAVLAALGVLALYVANHQGLLHAYVLLRTYTEDAAGLTVGSPVRLNGITVGYLDKLLLTDSRDPQRKVELDLRVKPNAIPHIPVDSTAGVAATSLVGDNYVNIVEGAARRHVQPGGELASRLPANTDEMLAQMQHILQEFDAITARADRLLNGVEQGQGTIGKWVKGTNQLPAGEALLEGLENDVSGGHGTLSLLLAGGLGQQIQSSQDRFHQIMAAFQAGQGTAGQLAPLLRDAGAAMREMNGLVAEMQAAGGASARLDALSQRFDELLRKVNTTFDKIESGEGTLGQLAINPQFSDALAGATRQFQQVMAGIRKNPRKFLAFQFRLF